MVLKIVYPRGNRSELKVVEVSDFEYHEYDFASRQSWGVDSFEEADNYARQLAKKHDLTYIENMDYPRLLD